MDVNVIVSIQVVPGKLRSCWMSPELKDLLPGDIPTPRGFYSSDLMYQGDMVWNGITPQEWAELETLRYKNEDTQEV